MRHGERKRGFLPAAAVALACVTALTGVGAAESTYLEQSVKTSGMMGQQPMDVTQKIWIGEGMFCVQDPGSGMVTIVDSATGKLTIVQPGERTYSEATREQMEAMSQLGMQMLEQMMGAEGAEVSVEQTGKTAKVGTWDAYEVIARLSGPMPMEMQVWLTKDLPVDMSVWSELVGAMPTQGMFGGMVEKIAALEGYPVKQRVEMKMMGMAVTSTTEVTAARPAPVDKTVCSVPAGFKKTEGPFAMPPGVKPR